ncbi:PREDICTED: uncharacterized protein LOC108578068 [Habropoda laboriosa]|uniref:uncharacterized protein LOC108578068 n=1 Tax=Habropoda laboriosa TaxID=597456 RepID=UPI00083DA877|nr:PREDICTED: uncharacterized protein LOC108578068 [Habropoda laboriosa]
MLTGRKVTVSHNDVTIHGRPASGCPQGGVLSPLLWCQVIDELLVGLQTAGFLTFGYADDVAVLVRRSFLFILKEQMEEALKNTELMPGHGLDGEYLDAKLSWKTHLEKKKNNFYASLWACKRAIGKTWGFKPSIALWIYKAILLPRLTYAAIVWWPTVKKVDAKNLLKGLQGSYLRAATQLLGGMEEHRDGAHETGVPGQPPFSLKHDKIPRKYQLQGAFKVHIPTRDDWKRLGFPGMCGDSVNLNEQMKNE